MASPIDKEQRLYGPKPDQVEKLPYSDQDVIVWGGSSGIGRRAVVRFAQLGARRVFLGSSRPKNYDLVKTRLKNIEKIDPNEYPIEPLFADVRDKAQVSQAVRRLKASGVNGNLKTVFSFAGGMEGYMQTFLTKYINPITDKYTRRTPIDELTPEMRAEVGKMLSAACEYLAVVTQDALPRAMAINYQGLLNVIDALVEEFPDGKKLGVLINSTWGDQSGLPGVQIPLLYRPVDLSRAMVRDHLQRKAPHLAKKYNFHIGEEIASLVNDTNVGKTLNNSFLNLMDRSQREAIRDSSVTINDVVSGLRMILDSDPTTWPEHPYKLYTYRRNGQVVNSPTLELSAMYTTPYRI